MFEVSVEKQKILMLVPVANILGLLVWVNNCCYYAHSLKTSLTGGLWAFIHFLPVAVLQFVLMQLCPDASSLWGLFAMYLGLLAMDLGLIRFQEKHLL